MKVNVSEFSSLTPMGHCVHFEESFPLMTTDTIYQFQLKYRETEARDEKSEGTTDDPLIISELKSF